MLNIDIDSGLRNNAATMIRGKLRIKSVFKACAA